MSARAKEVIAATSLPYGIIRCDNSKKLARSRDVGWIDRSALHDRRFLRWCPRWRDRRGRRIADDANPDRAVRRRARNGCRNGPFFAAATKTIGSVVHGFNRTIEWRIVGRLATGSVPATALALVMLSWLDMRSSGARHLITAVLCIMLLLTAGVLIVRNKISALYAHHLSGMDDRSIARLTIAMGALLEILVTFSSVGAGAIGVTALVVPIHGCLQCGLWVPTLHTQSL